MPGPPKGTRHRGTPLIGAPSRNPGGRPKAAAGWRESLRNDESLREDILKLARGAQTKADKDTVKYLLDQGFGRASQSIELSGGIDLRTAAVDVREWAQSIGKLEEFEAWVAARSSKSS